MDEKNDFAVLILITSTLSMVITRDYFESLMVASALRRTIRATALRHESVRTFLCTPLPEKLRSLLMIF